MIRKIYMDSNGGQQKGVPMWKDKLKKAWNDNPLQVVLITGFAATAAAKVLDALSAAQGRRAYAKQVDYKVRNRK